MKASSFLLTIALAAGCEPAADSSSINRSDSLGVSLIEYAPSFAAAAAHAWSTDPEPVLSIGAPDAELFRVRVALFQSDGGIVVAHGGAYELLLFDHTGRLYARAGGEGGGPGEFHQLTYLSVGPADSLYAYDAGERRLSVFDPRGPFARAATLQGLDTLGTAEQVGVLRSGEIVGAFRRRTAGAGLVRDSLLVMTFMSSDRLAARLGVFPHLYTDWGPHPVPGDGTASVPLPVPLSSVTAVTVGDSAIYVGLPDRYALIRLTPGGVRRITRQREPPRAVTEADRARLFAALGGGRMRGPELAVLRGLKGPGTLPAFGVEPLTARVGEPAMLVTDLDGVWLRPFQLPDDSVNVPWPRFTGDGLYEGTVTLPPRFRPTAVRGDLVLGVYRDATDVEYVRAYRLAAHR